MHKLKIDQIHLISSNLNHLLVSQLVPQTNFAVHQLVNDPCLHYSGLIPQSHSEKHRKITRTRLRDSNFHIRGQKQKRTRHAFHLCFLSYRWWAQRWTWKVFLHFAEATEFWWLIVCPKMLKDTWHSLHLPGQMPYAKWNHQNKQKCLSWNGHLSAFFLFCSTLCDA